jgi:hypothetical protein
MKLQLIEGINSISRFFKVTDGETTEFFSFVFDGEPGRTRNEALARAQEMFSFWLEHGSPENVIKEIEFKEV